VDKVLLKKLNKKIKWQKLLVLLGE
jgi:hypothetical protein